MQLLLLRVIHGIPIRDNCGVLVLIMLGVTFPLIITPVTKPGPLVRRAVDFRVAWELALPTLHLELLIHQPEPLIRGFRGFRALGV